MTNLLGFCIMGMMFFVFIFFVSQIMILSADDSEDEEEEEERRGRKMNAKFEKRICKLDRAQRKRMMENE